MNNQRREKHTTGWCLYDGVTVCQPSVKIKCAKIPFTLEMLLNLHDTKCLVINFIAKMYVNSRNTSFS